MARRGERAAGRVRRARRLAVWVLVLSLSIPAAAESTRAIVYANVGGDRVQRAFEQLNRALGRAGVFSRHAVALRHEVVHEHQPEVLRAEMERIVASRPAAIVAPNAVIAAAAKQATAAAQIPVVFGSWESPVHVGLVESLARPGRNVTGFTFFQPLEEKRLELLKELSPGVRRVGVLADRLWLRQPHVAGALQAAARKLDLVLETFGAENEAELQAVLDSDRARSMHAWYVPLTEVVFEHPDLVVQAFHLTQKPVMYTRSIYVEKGGLAAYQSELGDVFDLWAKLLGQVLDGVPPAIIPIERPMQFELALNVERARAIGLAIPRSLLLRADRFY